LRVSPRTSPFLLNIVTGNRASILGSFRLSLNSANRYAS
jgi:hypothetical protein